MSTNIDKLLLIITKRTMAFTKLAGIIDEMIKSKDFDSEKKLKIGKALLEALEVIIETGKEIKLIVNKEE